MDKLKHRLLKRQIRKHLSDEEFQAINRGFIDSIDNAYQDFDKDHYALENLLEQNNKELFKFNARLNSINAELEQKVKERTLQLEEQTNSLKEVNQKLDRFARVVSHDLRSPLDAVEALIHLIELEDIQKNPQDAENFLGLIKNRVSFMRNLINGILAFSKASQAAQKIEVVNLQSLLTEISENLNVHEKVSIEVQAGFPTINTDRVGLQQVFMNLIGNAIKFNDKNAAIVKVGFEVKANDAFEFYVADNGKGIPKYEQNLIFEVFYHGKQDKIHDSSGLGLSIVKQIVENNGSQIRVESEVGKGSKFVFGWKAKG
jgi:signal transduction histidine kinase